MLDGSSSLLIHRVQGGGLIFASVLLLPFSTLVVIGSYALQALDVSKSTGRRVQSRQDPTFQAKRILVTGVGMTKGLCLARMFFEAGQDVIGADFSSLACGRVSTSLEKFYQLEKPTAAAGSALYIANLRDIIAREKIDLWVSCSGVASAVEDGEAKETVEATTSCKAVQFSVKDTEILHQKHSFIQHTASIGLPVPETHHITSRAQVEGILRNIAPERRFILKTVGVDDSVRADMTLLPKPTPQETSAHIAKLKISEKTPWILQHFLAGPEFCTHALVVRGQVKAFVACPSAELLMHYVALPPDSPLSKVMFKFTESFAAKGGRDFTGHLSFDFLAETDLTGKSAQVALLPIECNPRAHTAVKLFSGTPSMVEAYLSLLDDDEKEDLGVREEPVTPLQPQKTYWIGHDLFELIILPCLSMLLLRNTLSYVVRSSLAFIDHLLRWKDGTYEVWDPLPWFWLYHVYWPMQFFDCIIRGRKWSRVNVSTTKMFEC